MQNHTSRRAFLGGMKIRHRATGTFSETHHRINTDASSDASRVNRIRSIARVDERGRCFADRVAREFRRVKFVEASNDGGMHGSI